MLEDEGDCGAEVLSVIIAHKDRDDIREEGGRDFMQQALVCLMLHCLILSVQDQGGLSHQLANPWSGGKAHHRRACRARPRLISWRAEQNSFFIR